jgi:hypothetical protein
MMYFVTDCTVDSFGYSLEDQRRSSAASTEGMNVSDEVGLTHTNLFNLYEPCVLYIGQAHRYPPNTPFYIFFQQIYVINFF